LVVDGHAAYVVTNDSQIEAWALGHNSVGPTATATVAGAAFSRPPAVQDDRLVIVDDAGILRVFDLSTTPAGGGMPLLGSALNIGAADTSRFGDLEIRGGSIVVSRALTNQALPGIFSIAFSAQTGALGLVQSKPKGFGTITPIGDRLIVSDGLMVGSPAQAGLVSGVFAIETSNLNIKTSTQAVIAPFGTTAIGHVVITANRDAGIETFTLGR
jgi:hypothetical protein